MRGKISGENIGNLHCSSPSQHFRFSAVCKQQPGSTARLARVNSTVHHHHHHYLGKPHAEEPMQDPRDFRLALFGGRRCAPVSCFPGTNLSLNSIRFRDRLKAVECFGYRCSSAWWTAVSSWWGSTTRLPHVMVWLVYTRVVQRNRQLRICLSHTVSTRVLNATSPVRSTSLGCGKDGAAR